ncbi:MAG: helix-turn-helix transcriptional regulator [Tyzzerella sp.]|nr:helix-turn-helix transcriptional regulator [Tyzzerella sp.]
MKISNINLVTFNEESKNDSFYASYKCKVHNYKTHWHDFYEIHLITSGTICECINGHKIEMGPGWIYFLKPYDVHEYSSDGPVAMYKIQFMIDILDSDIQKTLISDKYRLIMKLSDKEQASLIPFLSKIVEERNSNKYGRLKTIGHLMNCLAIELIRLSKKQTYHTSNSDTMVMALEYIHHNYTNNITMQEVADYVGLTPNYFCSKFHKEIGQSFKQYLRGLQLNHAATLLRVSDRSISTICEESGINSLAHFLKDFKTYYGMTPSQYRKQT